MEKLYQNIKEMRRAKGLTQFQVAERLGYKDRSMIAKIEAGKVDITIDKVQGFADLFNVDPMDLMGLFPDEGLQQIGLVYKQLNEAGRQALKQTADVYRGMPMYAQEKMAQ